MFDIGVSCVYFLVATFDKDVFLFKFFGKPWRGLKLQKTGCEDETQFVSIPSGETGSAGLVK